MSKTGDINCNLCGKNLTDSQFKTHFSAKHLPKKKFVCFKCSAPFSSSNELQSHLTSYHAIENEKSTLKNYCPKNLFNDCNDVVRHAKESQSWVRFAFNYGFENSIDKKSLKSLVQDLHAEKIRKIRDDSSVCKFCDDTNATVFCYFCGQHFDRICFLKSHILDIHLVLPNMLKTVIHCCETCHDIFQSKKLLEEHCKGEHNEEKSKFTPSICCQYCGKCLANKSNLKRHILNQHSVEVGASPASNVFTCHYCKCCFSNKSSVKRHIENLHLKEKDTRKSISCYQCEQRFNSIKNLNAHLTVEHDVEISERKIQFVNLSEFWNWKQKEEIRTNARYIQLRGLRKQRRKGEEISTLKFVCNRSGIFHSKSNGKRAYRIKGSSKIGRYCSAYIEITFKNNVSVDGIYCSTHSGHDNDLRYLALTMDEKREIYEKIKSGTTFSTILNEIRNSVGKEIKRKHLVTNKDLHNIVTTFKKLSKPENELPTDNESSSSDMNTFSNDLISATIRSDRSFNNDLDVCADLWVETCQRMINNFDQDQPKTVTVAETNPKESLSAKNITISNEEVHTLGNDGSTESSHANYSNNFVQSKEYSSHPPSYSSVIQPAVEANNLWLKQPHYTSHGSEELDPQLVPLASITSHPDNSPCTPASNLNKNEENFCGLQSMLNDLQMTKDFYSADTTLSSTIDRIEQTAFDNSKNSTVCPNDFCDLQPPIMNNPDTSASCLPSIGVYDKGINQSLSPAMETFDQSYILTESEETLCDDLPPSPDEPEKSVQWKDVASEGAVKSKLVTQNKSNSELSDLRDRVNSVTALYNIVESELDERKKNIIRNYVDNMFRVLQYRYNKCKTKKKQTTNDKKSPSLARRRLNSKRSNRINQTRIRKSVKVTPKSNRPKSNNNSSSAPAPTQVPSKNNNAPENDFNYSTEVNGRSNVALMHWSQY